jgi:hypothetical protein
MRTKTTGLLALLAVLIAVSVWFLAAQAQDRDDKKTTGKSVTATGCLAKGDSAKEFYLTADDGTRYELRSDSVSLAEHVGHKVSVTGTNVKESGDKDDDDDEKDEARENKAANLQVTDLKMVSNSCK